MKPLDLGPLHPVTLSDIEYVEFSFQRLSPKIEPPLLFPEFDVNLLETGLHEGLAGFIVMQVVTKPLPMSTTEEQIIEKIPVLSFSFTLIAHFDCAEFEGARNALEIFMASDTPALIVWPYIRGFVADMVNRAGLPGYHLPLLQVRTTPASATDSKEK